MVIFFVFFVFFSRFCHYGLLKLPFLSKLYKKFELFFASNGPIENSFSAVTLLIDNRQNRTKTEILEMRLILKEYFQENEN